jgi:transcriptional regulator with XRE-family HTH domain
MNIGQNIRRIREIKNLKQEAVADALGMSVTANGNIERGDADVNFSRLGEIANALNVKEEDIVTFGSTVYNNTFNNNENGVINGTGAAFINTSNTYTIDKEVFDKMMKDKDEEIAFLRERLRKGSQ